jgi:acetolactate synthase-1/2/3 large subunit
MKSEEGYGGQVAAQALKDGGVDAMFGILGTTDLIAEAGNALGIKHYVTRHEQAGGFAADGYARSLRKPGVAFTSNGPGMANAVGAMYHAKGANSPVVLLAGSHSPIQDGLVTWQESYPAKVLEDTCKWTHRITDPRMLGYWIRKSLRDAVQPTPGPITLDIAYSTLSCRGRPEQFKYPREERVAHAPRTGGDPDSVGAAVNALAHAKRPVIIAGDGVYWSDGAQELLRFAELMHIPTCTRRTARGALPETHPLAFTFAFRKGFIEHADVICLIGNPVNGMDEWFEPPDWNHDATWIQIQDTQAEMWYGGPTDVAIVGSSKLVMKQMAEYARQNLVDFKPDRRQWLESLAKARQRIAESMAAQTARLSEQRPLHHHVLTGEIASFLDPSATVIFDSFSASPSLTSHLRSQAAGQVLDAGTFQTLGHSIGMAIGAQVARPGKQVLALIGDGGFGIAGMDMETMVRYGLPAVAVVFNNSSWGGRAWGHEQWYPERASGEISDVRYDQMMRSVGCHTEHVTEAHEIRPALERSFASGLPSVINVVGDSGETSLFRGRINLMEVWTRGNAADLPAETVAEIRSWPKGQFERTAKMGRDNFGHNVTARELAEMMKVDFDWDRK